MRMTHVELERIYIDTDPKCKTIDWAYRVCVCNHIWYTRAQISFNSFHIPISLDIVHFSCSVSFTLSIYPSLRTGNGICFWRTEKKYRLIGPEVPIWFSSCLRQTPIIPNDTKTADADAMTTLCAFFMYGKRYNGWTKRMASFLQAIYCNTKVKSIKKN